MTDQLIERINRLREDKNLADTSEEGIRQGVILPILHNIGWDTYNIEEVIPEYKLDGGRVDYCLRAKRRNLVFIEVKRLQEDLEKHDKQLLNYAFAEGVELAVLTNGLIWWFYLPLVRREWHQRRFFTIDIQQQDQKDIAINFRDLLGKEAIISGAAVTLAKQIFESREKEKRIKQALPIAWEELLTQPDPNLVELLIEKVASISGYQPNETDVVKYITNLVQQDHQKAAQRAPYKKRTSRKTEPKISSRVAETAAEDIAKQLSTRPPRKSGIVIKVNNEIFSGNVRQIYEYVLDYLITTGYIQQLKQFIPYKTSNQRYLIAYEPVHPSGEGFVRPVQNQEYFMEAHKSYSTAMKQLQIFLKQIGLDLTLVEGR